MDSVVARSYAQHAAGFEADITDPARQAIVATWTDPSYLANVHEARLGYEMGEYFGRHGYTAVTIGDGRGGLDSIRLRQRGAPSVLPTDISPFLLEWAKREGAISDYRVENAEALSFQDRAFDFAFMKEAYHHCPRAPLALQEMLRITRRGVVLVEPQDQAGTPYEFLRRLKGKGTIPGVYEEVGNFVYRLSLEEVLKVAFALNLPAVAYRYENFAAAPGFDFVRANEVSKRAIVYRLTRALRRVCAAVRIIRQMMLLVTILKEAPSPEQRVWFQRHGWKVKNLQRNPYWT